MSRVAAKLAGMGGTGGRDGGRRQAVDANLGIAGERADSLHRGAGELATATGRGGGTGEDEVFSAFDDTHTLVPRKHVDRPDDYWTMNHLKLLYLISKYSHFAQTAQDKEQWVRKLPLLVLVYRFTRLLCTLQLNPKHGRERFQGLTHLGLRLRV